MKAVVECTGLENRQGFVAPLGFKSLSLHHYFLKNRLQGGFLLSGDKSCQQASLRLLLNTL